ncbi:sugar-binding transcriptional regulator [Pseudolysinimonas sp.]|uniref:sugar-binding transcriptional regulator n=1 Tax=Pseudolysinimonas sp. TaxID=2680009 RepID=UPI003F804E76
MLEEDELLAVRAAELYYDEGKTQDEVGVLLELSRWKVGRLLADAREQGIVRIEIVHPRARRLGVERELQERFGLKDAVVVPAPDDERELLTRVAQAAADHLAALRPAPRTLGVSWGRTLAAVADRLVRHWARGVEVVQVNGGVTLNRRPGTAAPTASTIAAKADGEAVLLPSPAILERLETKQAIVADRVVADALARAASASAYLLTAGAAVRDSALVESGYLTPDDIAELVRKGAVGDVLGRFVDADGNIVDPALDERTVGLGLDRLRAAETAILVVAGRAKHDIARTVVTSGLCTVLVTDDATARALLEDA